MTTSLAPNPADDLTSVGGKVSWVTKVACAVDSDPSCPAFIA